jgi:hypothetical protein
MKVIKTLLTMLIFHQFCIAQRADSVMPIRQKVLVSAFPNPAKNQTTFKLNNFAPGAVQVQIIDITGTMVYNEKRLVVLKEDEITIFFQLKKGNYWCSIKQKDKMAKVSLLVIE